MADWQLCSLCTKKEAVTVILWYATFMYATEIIIKVPFQNLHYMNNTTIIYTVTDAAMDTSTIMFYLFFGFFADTFIGRYRMIQFSFWVKFLTVIMSTVMAALYHYEYYFSIWQLILLYSVLYVMEMMARSSFHVVAIQFGMDQLQGAPSQLLSSFIFWYFMVEYILPMMYQWVFDIFDFINIKWKIVQLCVCLFNAVLFSAVLAVNNWCMSEWFVREKTTSRVSQACSNHSRRSDNSNPFCLIYRILKYAKEHRSPVQRSALTYWENKLPSRIDLGKRKYGGPFTTEEVEDVKTFLQLCLLLISLSGILLAWNMFPCGTDSGTCTEFDKHKELIYAVCDTTTVGLLIVCRLLCCFNKCHLSMLRRIGIGAALTILYYIMFSVITANSVKRLHMASLNFVNIILPNILNTICYIVFTVSLIEFIIAQSPHAMKGLLIGFYYVIRHGVGGLFDLVQWLICTHVDAHTTRLSISCCMLSNIVMIIIAVLSFIVYCVLACKYKLRERDEVINVHIFAEEYYGTRENDSDTSDIDQDE